ncbi:MAG: hypothetical protein V2J24_05365 [Pseudomonadales bacterium]|jgi:hypothetical protein|nr:hypothetical protein [Pseudomonadales bacterium]
MLFAPILVRFLTDLCDLPTLLAFDLASNPARVIAIFVFLYYLPVPFALRHLWRRMRVEAP